MDDMSLRKKKRMLRKVIPLTILLLLLIVALTVFIVVSKIDFEDDIDSSETVDDTIVLVNTTASVSSMTYASSGYGNVTLKLGDDSVWYYTEDHNFPVDQDKITAMTDSIKNISATRWLEAGDSGEYGFDEPALSVNAEFSDGTTVSIMVGDTNTNTGNTYLKDNTTDKVYMFTDSLTTSFKFALNDLVKTDIASENLDENYLVDVTLNAKEGTQNIITDNDGISALIAQNDLIDCSKWVEYYADKTKMAEYGIGAGSTTMTINFRTTVAASDESTSTMRVDDSYTVTFGNITDDGEYIYYIIPDSTFVYKLDITVYNDIMSYMTYVSVDTTVAADTDATNTDSNETSNTDSANTVMDD